MTQLYDNVRHTYLCAAESAKELSAPHEPEWPAVTDAHKEASESFRTLRNSLTDVHKGEMPAHIERVADLVELHSKLYGRTCRDAGMPEKAPRSSQTIVDITGYLQGWRERDAEIAVFKRVFCL